MGYESRKMSVDYCPRCASDDVEIDVKNAWLEDWPGKYWAPAKCGACGLDYNLVFKFEYAVAPEEEINVKRGEELNEWLKARRGI